NRAWPSDRSRRCRAGRGSASGRGRLLRRRHRVPPASDTGTSHRVEHWEVAKGHGRGVAASVAREHAPYSTLPYFWSDQYDVSLEYRGNASGMDELVWRGDRDALRFSVFYL